MTSWRTAATQPVTLMWHWTSLSSRFVSWRVFPEMFYLCLYDLLTSSNEHCSGFNFKIIMIFFSCISVLARWNAEVTSHCVTPCVCFCTLVPHGNTVDPNYPTAVIRRAVSECSILSIIVVRDWILSRPHLLTLNNKGRRPLQTYCCPGAGVTLPQRKGRRLISKCPVLISWKYKLFHLQIYIKYYFCSWIFSFDAVLYFLRNLTKNRKLSYKLSWYLPSSFSLVFRVIRHFRLPDRPSVPSRSDNRDSTVFTPQ
jgi:hypothetical protein